MIPFSFLGIWVRRHWLDACAQFLSRHSLLLRQLPRKYGRSPAEAFYRGLLPSVKTGTARDYDYSYWNVAKCFELWEGPFTEFDSALLDAKDTLAEVLKSRCGERRRGLNGRFFEDHLV